MYVGACPVAFACTIYCWCMQVGCFLQWNTMHAMFMYVILAVNWYVCHVYEYDVVTRCVARMYDELDWHVMIVMRTPHAMNEMTSMLWYACSMWIRLCYDMLVQCGPSYAMICLLNVDPVMLCNATRGWNVECIMPWR